MSNTLGNELIQASIRRFKAQKQLADKTFEQLSETDFHYQPDRGSNNIAIIIQHIAGNMLSRWTNLLTEDGEKPWRKRDEEFEDQQYSKEQLLKLWEDGWNCLFNTLQSLKESDLLTLTYIRKEPLTVADAIIRQMAHYPSHVGQIVYLGKQIKKDEWKSLSIEKGKSEAYNNAPGIKDPAKQF
jgi:uncharacterized damage-inducible protein DinB